MASDGTRKLVYTQLSKGDKFNVHWLGMKGFFRVLVCHLVNSPRIPEMCRWTEMGSEIVTSGFRCVKKACVHSTECG